MTEHPPVYRLQLAGAGGQGVLSAARFLAAAAHRAGLPVVVGQLHGMAQRGGTVTATVVIGSASSIMPPGGADVLLATELLEAARQVDRLRPGGLAVVSLTTIVPPRAAVSRTGYPPVAELLATLRRRCGRLVVVDAARLALAAGSPQVQNVVMLGALAAAGGAPVNADQLRAAIEEEAPRKRDTNRRAFELGLTAVDPGDSSAIDRLT